MIGFMGRFYNEDHDTMTNILHKAEMRINDLKTENKTLRETLYGIYTQREKEAGYIKEVLAEVDYDNKRANH